MISVLTVNYHSADQVRELHCSLADHPVSQPLELIVTNNSPRERIDLLAESAAVSVNVLDAANVGFAAGINIAFRAARGEVVMVANPDVRLMPGAMDAAAAILADRPDVGIVLPRMRYPDGRVQPSVRRFYTWPVVLYARSPLRWLLRPPRFFRRYLYEDLDPSREAEVDWGLGGAMWLRRADTDAHGPFDERFFLYFEDVDLCLRTWRRGRRVLYAPWVECIHAHRRSSRNPLTPAGWQHFRSLTAFIRKYRGLPQRP